MNFEQLEYVKAVVEYESMTRASEALHISQSALSQSIASLEKELEHKLFNRSRSGTVPTENGKKLIPIILEILESESKLRQTANSLSAILRGKLTVATSPSLFMAVVPPALSSFRKDNPLIDVQIIEAENEEIYHLVQKKEIDIGLFSLINDHKIEPSMEVYSLFISSSFKAIVPIDSKLAFRESISLEDIQDSPFILFDREFYNVNIEKFEENRGPLNILFTTKNPSVLFRSVSSGLGISIVSDLMLQNNPYLQTKSIAAIPIGYPFNNEIQFVALSNKDNGKKQLTETFISYIRNKK
ncbi:LysR family transcriptional regulator [Oceanobacillus sp. J11TS1]|uniref:LysR family transcriptional regulator n=1 Tax=Oceanobacillus sp. J11TS1 TaxID=2807191 RepID=UPI001B24511F|nr:LysR family transcriptional regulator [Oceanobacillus sp. J11TS1]GIO24701.1 LysR family transcriptional regulator [Oceanobacillus sp. J11TS1]